jgi:hypothetical protein
VIKLLLEVKIIKFRTDIYKTIQLDGIKLLLEAKIKKIRSDLIKTNFDVIKLLLRLKL